MIVDFLPHRKAKQDPPTVVVAVIKVVEDTFRCDVFFSLFQNCVVP